MSCAFILPEKMRRKRRGRLPLGAHRIIPAMLRFFHDPVEEIIGVLPRNAQVVATKGRSEIPDSS